MKWDCDFNKAREALFRCIGLKLLVSIIRNGGIWYLVHEEITFKLDDYDTSLVVSEVVFLSTGVF